MAGLTLGVIMKRRKVRVPLLSAKIYKLGGKSNVFDLTAGGKKTITGARLDGVLYGPDGESDDKFLAALEKIKEGATRSHSLYFINGTTEITSGKFKKTAEFGGTGAGKADAATTRAQEKGSAYILLRALKDNKKWKDAGAILTDKTTMPTLNALWQNEIKKDVDEEWLEGYYLQHKKMLDEFSDSTWNVFDHSGSGSFMSYITKKINKKFNIRKKDNWNPADIWMIKGTVDEITKVVDDTVDGPKISQTIMELNTLLRGMYNERRLVGVSLKAISGKEAVWEEYNLKALTLEEVAEYNFPDIKLFIDVSPNMTQDSKAQLRKTGKGYNFQIKANSSTSWSRLKWESTMVGATAARGGKAATAGVKALLEHNGITVGKNLEFDPAWQNYPQNAQDFSDEQTKWKEMFDRVNKEADTKCNDKDEFYTNIEKMFTPIGGANAKVANSKLMQLSYLDSVLKIKNATNGQKAYEELWTDMVFLSIKKGDKFGPFGKLY